jgi:two-component system OmpR family sensor kinase
LYRSEKRSLFRFLAIYLVSTLILFSAGSYIFYVFEKHHLLDLQRESVKHEGEKIQHQLIRLQSTFRPTLPIYLENGYDIALLDIDKKLIFSNFDLPKDFDFTQEYQLRSEYMIYNKPIDPYYLGAAYMIIRMTVDQSGIANLQKMILMFMLSGGVFFSVLGYFLGRMFVAPMRESIEMMNRFIQDTTHELNTPISTILTNLELMETLEKCDAKSEMQRIEIASKTLSRIYDDLTYLRLNQNYHREIRPLDLSRLLQERLLYFAVAIEAKRIRLMTQIDEEIIVEIDREDAIRLIDNLLSNAIKYNKTGGILEVKIDPIELSVKDSGVGIPQKELGTIFDRFKRANRSEGGFGIGLNIVYQIVQAYKYRISIDSEPNIGTEVTITWQK